MLLSICMMVKNEENNMERCLSSIIKLLEKTDVELIIVDTGSEDRTVEIASQYTSLIYHHPWSSNFSEMRNISISYASGEWIFILDADEELDGPESILAFLNDSIALRTYQTASLTVRNFTKNHDLSLYNDLVSNRFFRNDGFFHYEGIIHNMAVFKEPVIQLNTTLHHYGYINDDDKLMEKKFERTERLLKKELEKNPNNIYYMYQLSVSYGMYRKWHEAEQVAKMAFALIMKMNKNEKNNYFYVYSHMMIIYKQFGCYEKIIELCQEALDIRPEDIDSNFFMADALMSKKMIKVALPYYIKYLELIRLYEQRILALPLDTKLETIAFKNKVIFNSISILFEDQQYRKITELYKTYEKEILTSSYLEKSLEPLLNSFLIQADFKSAYDVYVGASKKNSDICQDIIERLEPGLSQKEKEALYSEFSLLRNTYGVFNRLRYNYLKYGAFDKEDEKATLTLETEVKYFHFDLLYPIMLKKREDNTLIKNMIKLDSRVMVNMFQRLNNKFSDFGSWLLEAINNLMPLELRELYFKISAEKFILQINDQVSDQDLDLFNRYIEDGMLYVQNVYIQDVIQNECNYIDITNKEHRFFLNMYRALGETDIRAFKAALKYNPMMSRFIKWHIDRIQIEIKKAEDQKQRVDYLQSQIEILIQQGNINQAKIHLLELEELVERGV